MSVRRVAGVEACTARPRPGVWPTPESRGRRRFAPAQPRPPAARSKNPRGSERPGAAILSSEGVHVHDSLTTRCILCAAHTGAANRRNEPGARLGETTKRVRREALVVRSGAAGRARPGSRCGRGPHGSSTTRGTRRIDETNPPRTVANRRNEPGTRPYEMTKFNAMT